MSFRDTKDLDDTIRVNKTERTAKRLIPEVGKFKEIEVGAGGKTFKMDRRGIWLGAEEFEDAPFSLSMDGLFKLLSKQGFGTIGMDADKGLWLGAERFEDAPFSVDIKGNMKLRATPETPNMSMEWIDEDGKIAMYQGFEEIP